jgi:hypothetical protein
MAVIRHLPCWFYSKEISEAVCKSKTVRTSHKRARARLQNRTRQTSMRSCAVRNELIHKGISSTLNCKHWIS